jgi:hypothetical protein
MGVRAYFSCFLPVLFLLGACSTLSDAQKLASKGGEAAGTLQTSATAVYDNFNDTSRMDAIAVAYGSGGQEDVQPIDPATMKSIRAALKDRVDITANLATAYVSLGTLAGATASGDTEKGITDLYQSVSKLSVDLGGNALPDNDASAVGAASGLIMSLVQRDKALDASDQIKLALQCYDDLLKAPANRRAIVSLSKDAIEYRYTVLMSLWDKGLLTGDQSFLTGVITKSGVPMKLNMSAAQLSRKDAAFNAYMKSELNIDRTTQEDALSDEYDAHIKLIEGLITQHETLAKGGVLDFAQISAWAAKLQTIAGDLKSSPVAASAASQK